MCSWRERKRDFLEMQGHGLAVAGGQDESGAFSFGRTDGSENIGRRRPLVARRGGPGSIAALIIPWTMSRHPQTLPNAANYRANDIVATLHQLGTDRTCMSFWPRF
jgi:hypothetical protein